MKQEKCNEPSTVTFPLITDESLTAPDFGKVFVPPPEPNLVFQHKTIAGISQDQDNIEPPWYWTKINHQYLNNNPRALITVTAVGKIEIDAENSSSNLRHNNHPVGVLYRENIGHWYIYNLNLQAMAVGAVFNVVIEQR